MNNKIVTLAHYYTEPEVQKMADKVGDSLELSLFAKETQADVIVFAGVRFMAETAKILNPQARVILPDLASTCSLVTQTDIKQLKIWREHYADYVHVAYINSSAEHKALSDWIVTSRNVDDIIADLYSKGEKVIFSPDRNMGAYLNDQYGYDMPLWSAVCEVHDKFNESSLLEAFEAVHNQCELIAHPESPLPVLKQANYVGSTSGMLAWVKRYHGDPGKVIFVATEDGILFNMREARPDLDLRQAPIYAGCQCNSCPYMKRNTVEAVLKAQQGISGIEIDYLSEDAITAARLPIERMLEFSRRYYD
jgi:quinolinate synthase